MEAVLKIDESYQGYSAYLGLGRLYLQAPKMLGGDPATGREAISEEELRGLVAAHESLSTDERRLIDDVFEASEHSVSEVMVSRTEVTFLEASMTVSRRICL